MVVLLPYLLEVALLRANPVIVQFDILIVKYEIHIVLGRLQRSEIGSESLHDRSRGGIWNGVSRGQRGVRTSQSLFWQGVAAENRCVVYLLGFSMLGNPI
jgi:hypothetical protein